MLSQVFIERRFPPLGNSFCQYQEECARPRRSCSVSGALIRCAPPAAAPGQCQIGLDEKVMVSSKSDTRGFRKKHGTLLSHGVATLGRKPPMMRAADSSDDSGEAKTSSSDTSGTPPSSRAAIVESTLAMMREVKNSDDPGESKTSGFDKSHIVTTIMIRNIPKDWTQTSLLQALDQDGFSGLYDFCYLPIDFHSQENKSYAFVNFVSPEGASLLCSSWHRKNLGASDSVFLNLSAASLQGLEDNMNKWCGARFRRVRNPAFRPFVARKNYSR